MRTDRLGSAVFVVGTTALSVVGSINGGSFGSGGEVPSRSNICA